MNLTQYFDRILGELNMEFIILQLMDKGTMSVYARPQTYPRLVDQHPCKEIA
jgi:hypothetical protein